LKQRARLSSSVSQAQAVPFGCVGGQRTARGDQLKFTSRPEQIIEKFLRNIASQLQPGTRLCLAVPAWQAPSGHFHHLPLLDHLAEMGYN